MDESVADKYNAQVVAWYRRIGKYPERITREFRGAGREYLEGDLTWNARNPDRKEVLETRTDFPNAPILLVKHSHGVTYEYSPHPSNKFIRPLGGVSK